MPTRGIPAGLPLWPYKPFPYRVDQPSSMSMTDPWSCRTVRCLRAHSRALAHASARARTETGSAKRPHRGWAASQRGL